MNYQTPERRRALAADYAIGIATVVCGPGSMEQGHKPDEFVSIEQLAACDAMLERLLLHLRL